MKKCTFALPFIMAVFICASLFCGLPGISHGLSAGDQLAGQIDRMIEKAEGEGFAGAVLVVDPEIDLRVGKAVGVADRTWDVKHTLASKFLVGSNTKEFTAALILELIEEGAVSKTTGKALSLDGKISDYLDYYRKDTGRLVSIHHLLSMSSGIPSYTNLVGYFDFASTVNRMHYETKEFVTEYCSGMLTFVPGKKFDYSNSNFNILGAIIEELTGRSYEDVLSEKILLPLNLKDTGLFDSTTVYSDMSTGYNQEAIRYFTDMSVPFSAGAMYSTVTDIHAWDDGLTGGTILTAESLKKMFTPHVETNFNIPLYQCMYYGYGWYIQYLSRDEGESESCPDVDSPLPPNWVKVVIYNGALPDGFIASNMYNPETKQAVLVFTNHYHYDPYQLAYDIMKLLIRDK